MTNEEMLRNAAWEEVGKGTHEPANRDNDMECAGGMEGGFGNNNVEQAGLQFLEQMDSNQVHGILLCITAFLEYFESTCLYLPKEGNDESPRIAEYVQDLFNDSQVSIVNFLVAILYLERLCRSGIVITRQSLNALFLVSVMEASKFLDDHCPGNSFW